MASKRRGPGRPQKYPLSPRQEKRVKTLIVSGLTGRQIKEEMGIHEFAVLRVRRALRHR